MSQARNKRGVNRDQVLEFIRDWMDEKGYAPSFREIGEGVGLTSMSSVSMHVNRLEAEGRLWRPAGKTRAFQIREGVSVGAPRER